MELFVSPFTSVAPNRVKTRLNRSAFRNDPRSYDSDTFSFPARKCAVWRLEGFLDNHKLGRLKLILVTPQADMKEIAGTLYIINLRRNSHEVPFGPKTFRYVGDALSIDVNLYVENFEEKSELHIEVPTFHETKSDVHSNEAKTCTLSENLSKMLLAKTFSDVILEVEGEEIPAHKLILSAQSNVFMVMFQSGMQEERNSRVKITDIDAAVVKELLRYAYTGKVEKLENLASELMIAAEKYNMIDLKKQCREWLVANLSTETAARLMVVADSLSDETLMKAVTDFTVFNLSKVMLSSEWSSMTSQRPMLMEDILKAMLRLKIVQ